MLTRGSRAFAVVLVLALAARAGAAPAARAADPHAAASTRARAPRVTPKRPVEDHLQGRTIRDDYRWLENWNDPEVRRWSAAQNAVARASLDHLPDRLAILERVTALNQSIAPAYSDLQYCHGVTFAIKEQPPKQQPMLVRLSSLDGDRVEKVIVDPNRIDPSGGTSIDFYSPSLDGSKVAVSLSKGGSESGTVYVYEARTARRLGDVVPRVNGGTAGGSVAWNADGSGFFHTRYPAPGERPAADLDFYQQVYFHRLGVPASSDRYAMGRELPKIAEITLEASKDGRFLLADVRNGDGGAHAFYLARTGHEFAPLTRFQDRVVGAAFGPDALYLLSREGAPNGKVLRLGFDDLRLERARIVVPAGAVAIEGLAATARRLFVQDIVGGPSQVRVFSLTGAPEGQVPLPSVSAVGGIVPLDRDAVAIEIESYTRPPWWGRYDASVGRLAPTALAMKSPAEFSDIQVLREFGISKDGTRVPMTILIPRGTRLDGTAPTLLTGYGGYGLSERPGFSAVRRLLLDQGGVLAIANTRGGGEFGDAWHLAGNLTHKQNVFDDFAACAKHLIERHYTSPGRLAIQGGSNGGLLMGAMITQHPEMFRAVVSGVGIYDMLRVELSPNGLFNTTEFGTVKDPAQFAALYAYSPYHHVVDGTRYPAVLLTTGANDPRVDPMQSRKMTARLQPASASGLPILLRTSSSTGHGIGTPLSERNALAADVDAFLLDQLGIRFRHPVKRPAP